MKGKMLIVLAGLVLVFGMLIASCDNALYPTTNPDPADGSKKTLDLSFAQVPGLTPAISYQALAYDKGVQIKEPWGALQMQDDGTTPKITKGGIILEKLILGMKVSTSDGGVSYQEQ